MPDDTDEIPTGGPADAGAEDDAAQPGEAPSDDDASLPSDMEGKS